VDHRINNNNKNNFTLPSTVVSFIFYHFTYRNAMCLVHVVYFQKYEM